MTRVGFGVTVLARCLAGTGVDGIGSYTAELYKRLSQRTDIGLTPFSLGVDTSVMNAPHTLQLPHYMWSAALGLPSSGARRLAAQTDLVHATDHLIPATPKVPVLATLMDAVPLSHPEWVSLRLRSLKNALWKRAARRADRIVTISEYSRNEISRHFGIAETLIHVVPLGVDQRWIRTIAPGHLAEIARRLQLPENFFLFVGTLQPRKNVKRLIDAYCALPPSIRDDCELIVVGRAGWECAEEVAALSAGLCGGRVRWLKHLPDEDLVAVTKLASALVFPSLYEGFGLPVIEAFAAGTPVITSNTSALPEVAGDAALLVDPLDVTALSQAMQSLLDNTELADSLRARGRERVKAYTWERTAEETALIYHEMAGH